MGVCPGEYMLVPAHKNSNNKSACLGRGLGLGNVISDVGWPRRVLCVCCLCRVWFVCCVCCVCCVCVVLECVVCVGCLTYCDGSLRVCRGINIRVGYLIRS